MLSNFAKFESLFCTDSPRRGGVFDSFKYISKLCIFHSYKVHVLNGPLLFILYSQVSYLRLPSNHRECLSTDPQPHPPQNDQLVSIFGDWMRRQQCLQSQNTYRGRGEIGEVYLPTQRERTPQLCS